MTSMDEGWPKQDYDRACSIKYKSQILLSRMADRLLKEIAKGQYGAIPKSFDRLEYFRDKAERKLDELLDSMEQNSS